jgi:hypothetical protein
MIPEVRRLQEKSFRSTEKKPRGASSASLAIAAVRHGTSAEQKFVARPHGVLAARRIPFVSGG